MAVTNACATCATTYNNPLDPLSEKPLLPGRDLLCCGRSICSKCLNQNKRYETYCPYCQISTAPSLLPQGLRDPPPYSSTADSSPLQQHVIHDHDDELPAYSAPSHNQTPKEKHDATDAAPDVLHFLTPNDSMRSLALAYRVPIDALRRANNVFSDHLVQGRKTVIIPGEYYKGGVSLSPQPLEGEEEEIKRNKTRRWMVACKVADMPSASLRYDVALLYLQQAHWVLDDAISAYRDDERWEKEHPLEVKQRNAKGKAVQTAGMRRFVGSQANASSSRR